MKPLMIIIISCFFTWCCSNPKKQNVIEKSNESNTIQKFVETLSPYARIIQIPEDTLIFGLTKGATEKDTSWTFLVSKSNNSIFCRYSQLLPSTVTGFDDYIDTTSKLLYYDGFSFEVTESKWNTIVKLADIENHAPQDSMLYTGCFHCPTYKAYYDSKFFVSGKHDKDYLIALDSLLRKELINDLFAKKNNPKIRFK